MTATADKIRKATLESIKNRNALIVDSSDQVLAFYQAAVKSIQAKIRAAELAGRVDLNQLQGVLSSINTQLRELERRRDGLLYKNIDLATLSGASAIKKQVFDVNHQAAAFVRGFVGTDGLQLSDRLWRINQGAAQQLGDHIQHAIITGESSHQAAMRAMSNNEEIPYDVQDSLKNASASRLNQSISNIMIGDNYEQTERLFRTEIARAHGEAYMSQVFNVDGVTGVRFCLSPNHPKKDICDEHATADLYGLGAGVYPNRESCPWPAHPNTLSYVMAVFDDDKAETQGVKRVADVDELIQKGHEISEELLKEKKPDYLMQVHERLNKIRPTGQAIKFTGRGRGVDLVSSASRLFPDSWTGHADRAGNHFARYSKARGFQWTPTRDYARIKLSGFGTVSNVSKGAGYFSVDSFPTAVHELTHRLQATVPGLDDLFQTIHERRTKNDPIRTLKSLTGINYRSDEVAQEDHYINPYQGKIYSNIHGYTGKHGALEVMTVAFENALHPNPNRAYEFAEKDRELFDLVMGALFHYDP